MQYTVCATMMKNCCKMDKAWPWALITHNDTMSLIDSTLYKVLPSHMGLEKFLFEEV